MTKIYNQNYINTHFSCRVVLFLMNKKGYKFVTCKCLILIPYKTLFTHTQSK